MAQSPTAPVRTLLIGWNAADWIFLRPLCEKGLLPALTLLARNGVAGELQGLPPYCASMSWTSLATGKRAWRHGIHGSAEVDEAGNVWSVSSGHRRVPALWNMLSGEGLKTLVVGWPASHPAEAINGVAVSDTFFQDAGPDATDRFGGAVFPARLAEELAPLRVSPQALDPGIVRLLVPALSAELARHDLRLGRLAQHLAGLYSVHNVTASLLETEPWDFAAVHFDFLASILRDFASFAPPHGPAVARGAYARYSQVLEGACRLQDMLLAELLKIAGPETRVVLVSDHGFLTGGAVDPAPNPASGLAARHRTQGIFLVSGPDIRRDARLLGAGLLDITPTILHSYGLPVGADMDGRVLEEIFVSDGGGDVPLSTRPSEVATIPTWDARFRPDPERTGRVAVNDPIVAERQRVENSWNLGLDLFDAGRFHEALPYLEEAYWARPEQAHYLFWLVRCQAASGSLEEARQAADHFAALHPTLFREKGILALETGRPAWALEHFHRALEGAQSMNDVPTLKALALGQTGKWPEALELLQEEVTRHPTSETWMAIARVYLWLRRPQGAISAARQLLLICPHRAPSHFLLAQALHAAGEKKAAWAALSQAHRLEPLRRATRIFAENTFPERKDEWSGWEIAPENEETPGKLREKSINRRLAWEESRAKRRRERNPVDEMAKPDSTPLQETLEGAAIPSDCHYRPPWPDELERFNSCLENRTLSVPGLRPRIWETPPPHRLAGAAIWSAPERGTAEGPVEVRFRLRPEFREMGTATELLRELFAEIAAAGHRRVRLVLGEREPWERILANFGLRWTHMDECWVGDPVASYPRIQARAGLWASRVPAGWVVRKIEESDLAFITRESGALEFFDADRLRSIWQNIAPGLSCIVQSPAGPAGVLLATRRGMMGVLEFLGAAPGFRRHSALISYLAMARLLRPDHPEEVDWVMQLVDPGKGTASQALVRRFGGHLSQSYHHFSGQLRLEG